MIPALRKGHGSQQPQKKKDSLSGGQWERTRARPMSLHRNASQKILLNHAGKAVDRGLFAFDRPSVDFGRKLVQNLASTGHP